MRLERVVRCTICGANNVANNADIAGLLTAADKLAAVVELLLPVYEATWKDECKPTYCALQRGGLAHRPLLEAHAALGEPEQARTALAEFRRVREGVGS